MYDVAEAIQIANFRDGLDFNDPATYEGVMSQLYIDVTVTLPAPKDVWPSASVSGPGQSRSMQ